MTGQSADLSKYRILHSPQGSFVMPNRGIKKSDTTLTDKTNHNRRSQSSSRQSNNLEDLAQRQMRQKQINDALVQIESIYSNLMTPVNRRNKCICGSGSKCSNNCCSSQNAADKSPMSDNNNFTSYLPLPQKHSSKAIESIVDQHASKDNSLLGSN